MPLLTPPQDIGLLMVVCRWLDLLWHSDACCFVVMKSLVTRFRTGKRLTDERSECGGENGGRLDDEGHERSHQDGDVAGDPGDVGNLSIDGLLDDDGHFAWKDTTE